MSDNQNPKPYDAVLGNQNDYKKLPLDGSAWINYQSRIIRSMRGGSWRVSPDKCHSAYRLKVDRTNLIPENGFRVVCDIF